MTYASAHAIGPTGRMTHLLVSWLRDPFTCFETGDWGSGQGTRTILVVTLSPWERAWRKYTPAPRERPPALQLALPSEPKLKVALVTRRPAGSKRPISSGAPGVPRAVKRKAPPSRSGLAPAASARRCGPGFGGPTSMAGSTTLLSRRNERPAVYQGRRAAS